MGFILNSLVTITKTSLNLNKCKHIILFNARNYCVALRNSNDNPSPASAALENFDTASSSSKEGDKLGKNTKTTEQRILKVAVVGVPNAGKSTFINNIINHRVCPTSSKVHTTRRANKAICTTGNTQLVFYDTPGLVTQREIKKHNLEQSFKSAYRHAVQHANVIAVVHDVSNSWTRNELHSTVIDTLKAYPALPSLLILNKIDALKSKRILLELIRTLTNNTLTTKYGKQKSKINLKHAIEKDKEANVGIADLHKREVNWSHFSDVFLVSSITGNGLSDIHDYFVNTARAGAWQHSRETFTDVAPEELIVDSVRARLLDYLPQEIPYTLRCAIEFYNAEENVVYASVQITCPTARIERLICGESNGKLRQITERVTSDLVETFNKPISLTISTSSKNAKQ